jgi:small subunit ribosomal protein S20
MPIIKSAIKRAKQTIKRRERNVGIKHDIKTATKAFMEKPSAATLSAAHSEIDTAVKKNLIKKNTAARRKSSLSKIAKDAGVKLSTGKKTTTAKPPVAKAAPKATAAKPAVKKTVAPKAAAKLAVKKAAPKSAK